MKEKQNYEIHDRLKNKYDKIYNIFIDCGGKTTKDLRLLEILILLCPILYLILLKLLDSKKSFLNLIPLISLVIMIVLLGLYVKLTNDKLFKPYIKNLGLKPKNASICYSFATECKKNNIHIEDLKSVRSVLSENIDSYFSISLNIFLPILFNVITNLLSNIESIKEYIEFLIPLLFGIYAILFILANNKLIENKFFKKCIVYAEESYNMTEDFSRT